MADKMTRCPEGHFYDPTKHGACPWCALPPNAEKGPEKTRPVHPGAAELGPPPLPGSAMPPPIPPAPAGGARPGVTRRVGVETMAGKNDPVVGWLVCLEGPDRGRDFRLHSEKNFIGRSPTMDVCIGGDDTVSREKHGVVIFDPKKHSFWALSGDSSGLVYLNGEIVNSPTEMKRDDVIEVGQTKLVLIPFCDGKYSWHTETSGPPPIPAV